MKTHFVLIAVAMAAGAVTLTTPSLAQDPFIPQPPVIDTTNYGPGLGNILFDRWIDNRRAARGRVVPSYSYPSSAGRQTQVYRATRQAAPTNTATIHVTLPPDAKVWFDGNVTKQTGLERYFESPPLVPGYDYSYDIKAQWRNQNGEEVTQMRHVNLRANATESVDFLQPTQ